MDVIFMMSGLPILSLLLWVPMLAAALLFLRVRHIALATSGVTLVLVGLLLAKFDPSLSHMQLIEHRAWLPTLGISYALGVDGISVLLIALTVFMTAIVLIAAKTHVAAKDYNKYAALFLLMQGLMCGVFMATDAILFYIFFEAMMVPLFLVIGIWGGERRIYATMKFILYTFFGSLFFLVAIIYLKHQALLQGHAATTVFAIANFQTLTLTLTQQQWIFWGLLLAFAIKIPMWPVHTWLPDAHVEAPTGGSVLLAALTLKVGGYGLLRFLLPIVPQACVHFADIVIILSLVAIVYISLATIIQQDLKKLIAYSSIAHMAFVTLGLFVIFKLQHIGNPVDVATLGIDGAVLQMIAHGFISGALFLCVGILYFRTHSRRISDYGGVVAKMPVFASYFMLFALANIGMPGTVGFVGEFLVLLAALQANMQVAIIAGSALIFGAAYTLWMYKRVVFGAATNSAVAILQDLDINEKIVFVMLAVLIVLFGVWPNPLLNIIRSSSQHLATQLVSTI